MSLAWGSSSPVVSLASSISRDVKMTKENYENFLGQVEMLG